MNKTWKSSRILQQYEDNDNSFEQRIENKINFLIENSSSYNNEILNTTNDTNNVPINFTQMSQNAIVCVIAYSIIFIIAAGGNFSVFFSILQQLRRTKSRISLLILHLSIADLLVTFGVIPLEIIWKITIQWYGGNILCKICKLFSAFGLYLSSTVLICISLDRYFAIIHPLRLTNVRRRGRIMLSSAWISAAICSAPQSFIFHVEHHPKYPTVHQCVSILYFYKDVELIYNVFSVSIMYFLPLVIIIFTYGMIICKISRKSRQEDESRNDIGEASGRILLRRSDTSNRMERAKSRTLRLTFVIVIVFVFCWTPYVVMTLWYMFDRESAEKVDGRIQDALFIMAVANSCVNPLVYGSFTKECRRSMTNCFGNSNCIGEDQIGLERQGTHKIIYSASKRSTSKENNKQMRIIKENTIPTQTSFRMGSSSAPSPVTRMDQTHGTHSLNNKHCNSLIPSSSSTNHTIENKNLPKNIQIQVPITKIVNNQLVIENPLNEMKDFYSKPNTNNISLNDYNWIHHKSHE